MKKTRPLLPYWSLHTPGPESDHGGAGVDEEIEP